jgi:hypothetical protein
VNLLSKDQILGADDRRFEIVPVPEWGGDVRLRSLTGAERDEFESATVQQVGGQQRVNTRNLRARLVALCAVDGDGLPLFDRSDVIKLGSKSAAALERVFEAASRLCGLTEDDVKELEAGFDDAPNGASTSA